MVPIRDRSLVMGRGGGLQNGRGGEKLKLNPYKKGGRAENSFSHAKGGGGTKRFGVVLTWGLEVLAILKGGCK